MGAEALHAAGHHDREPLADGRDQQHEAGHQQGAGLEHGRELGVETGVDEEGRHQDVADQRLQPIAQRLDEGTARHRDAHDERAEDGVDAGLVGEPGGERQADHGDDERADRECLPGVHPALCPVADAAQARPADGQHQHRVGDAAHQGGDGERGTALDRGHHRGQQDPGDDVVDRRAGQRHGAEPGLLEAGVVDDPCQHRERGHSDRGGDEERRLPGAHLLGEVAALIDHQPADQAAEHHRRGDSGERGEAGRPGVAHEDPGVEGRSDEEHVEHQAQLAHHVERHVRGVDDLDALHDHLGREDPVLHVGGDRAQQGRSEREAGEHHRHDLGLSQPDEQRGEQPVRAENDGHLQEEMQGNFGWRWHMSSFTRRDEGILRTGEAGVCSSLRSTGRVGTGESAPIDSRA